MMAAIDAARTGAPALWLALPRAGAAPRRRQREAEQRLRDALFARMQRAGLAAARGGGLAHSGGWVACGVPGAGALGVDLEWQRPRRALELARFAYDPAEAARIAGLPAPLRDAAFLDLWVLKEAAAKALGLPLLTALARCRFEVERGLVDARLPEGGAWRALLWAPRPGLRLAWLGLGAAAGAVPVNLEWIEEGDALGAAQWELRASGSG